MSIEAVIQFPKSLSVADVGNQSEYCSKEEAAARESQSISNNSDEVLLQRLRERCRSAMSELFRRHGRAVFSVARRILQDDAEADDLRQEVFLYLFERADTFDAAKSSAASWIIQITYHRAIDRRRYLSRRHHYKHEEVEERTATDAACPSTSDLVESRVLYERLGAGLSAEQRRTLERHLFEGWTFREIAAETGDSLGNVRHQYYRAIERLRSLVFTGQSHSK